MIKEHKEKYNKKSGDFDNLLIITKDPFADDNSIHDLSKVKLFCPRWEMEIVGYEDKKFRNHREDEISPVL